VSDISSSVKQQMTNRNVEKKKKNTVNNHTLKLTITKNEIGIGE